MRTKQLIGLTLGAVLAVLAAACTSSDSPTKDEPPDQELPEKVERLELMPKPVPKPSGPRERIEAAIQNVRERDLQTTNGFWTVFHGILGLGPSVNRLVLGMLASALFVGSSFLLSYQVPPLLFHESDSAWLGMKDISLLGLAGCTLSLLVGLRLLRAIGKSGHLDQKVSK